MDGSWCHNLVLLYVNEYSNKYMYRKYGQRLMAVRVERFQAHTVPISNDMKHSDASSQFAWIRPALFRSLHLVNDPQFLEVDRTSQIARETSERQAKY